MNQGTDHRVQSSTRTTRPGRDASHRPERAVRPRDGHGEAKLAPRDRQRESRHVKSQGVQLAESQESTKSESIDTSRWTDASAVAFLVLSFANLVVFYWSLIGF